MVFASLHNTFNLFVFVPHNHGPSLRSCQDPLLFDESLIKFESFTFFGVSARGRYAVLCRLSCLVWR